MEWCKSWGGRGALRGCFDFLLLDLKRGASLRLHRGGNQVRCAVSDSEHLLNVAVTECPLIRTVSDAEVQWLVQWCPHLAGVNADHAMINFPNLGETKSVHQHRRNGSRIVAGFESCAAPRNATASKSRCLWVQGNANLYDWGGVRRSITMFLLMVANACSSSMKPQLSNPDWFGRHIRGVGPVFPCWGRTVLYATLISRRNLSARFRDGLLIPSVFDNAGCCVRSAARCHRRLMMLSTCMS